MSSISKYKARSVPQCVRCRNHGVKKAKKGHKQDCKFRNCTCKDCILLIERKEIESQIKTEEQKEQKVKSQTLTTKQMHQRFTNCGYNQCISERHKESQKYTDYTIDSILKTEDKPTVGHHHNNQLQSQLDYTFCSEFLRREEYISLICKGSLFYKRSL